MTGWAVVLVSILAAAVIAAAIAFAVSRFMNARAPRLISCPENHDPAVVRLDAMKATIGALSDHTKLRLSDCSRWPERQDCDQACLKQVAERPQDCLLQNILSKWYVGQNCSFCGKTFREVHWVDQKPALLNSDGKLVEWDDVPAETIPNVLSTHVPVCWTCAGVESFRRIHPELVVDRPWKAGEREARQL